MPSGDPIQHLSALTRDLAHLRYERAQAERKGDTAEVASIREAIDTTQNEIDILLQDPEILRQFQEFRQRQFDLVAKVHDIQQRKDRIHDLRGNEHTLAREHASRTPSSHTIRKLASLQDEQVSLRREMDTLLSQDSELSLAYRSWQLREYRIQLTKNRFAETPSREALIRRIEELLEDDKKVLLTGPTGTGKTELAKRAAREFSGEPEVISGHQGLTTYEVYGKPALKSPDGKPESTFTPGKLTRASRDGHVCIYDEVDLIPTQTLLRHKADFNLHPGESLSIQEDSNIDIPIKEGFGIIATANIKGTKHKERESLDPAFTRLFEPLPIQYFPKHELYDLCLASLIDRRGYLSLSPIEAGDLLKRFVDAAATIQEAYLGNPTTFYEKGGASTRKHAFLDKAVLDPGRVLNILKGWGRAHLKGQSFTDFLNTELRHFVNNEDYSSKDRFTLLDILTTHGFLQDCSIKDFLPSNFTPEEWQRHLAAHPPPSVGVIPSVVEGRVGVEEPLLDPLAVAALDPYDTRTSSAAEAADEFLDTITPPQDTIDITDLERIINLSSQYQSQIKILTESGLLSNGGLIGIDNRPYPVPSLAEIRSALSAQPHLQEKIAQGFNRLLIVPFGMPLDSLRERYKATLLDTDQSTGLKNAAGNTVPLNRNDPLFTWDQYPGADITGKLIYGPEQFIADRHFGKTKTEILSSSSGPAPRSSQSVGGWQVLLVEEMDELPREGKGRTLGGRAQLECNKKPSDYINILRNAAGAYAHEVGLSPEAYITLAITRLKEQGIVIDHDTLSYLLGGYFPAAGCVPRGCFGPGSHRAALGRDDPGNRIGYCGVRGGVKIL